MIWFTARSLRGSRGRSALLAVGVAVVLATTSLLGALARTSEAHMQGALAQTFRPAYDILVRPPPDVSSFERRRHLVRDTFLSDLFGGISTAQLAAVRAIPGLQAAPIENIGYVLASETVLFPFRAPTRGPNEQLFRLSARFVLPGGSASWGSAYLYVDRSEAFTSDGPGAVFQRIDGATGGRVRVCGSQSQPATAASSLSSPFSAGHLGGYISCYSEVTPSTGSFPAGRVLVPISFDFPLLLTAVDPRIESTWFGLRRAVVSGRYLASGMAARRVANTSLGTILSVPVLASSSTDLEEHLVLSSSRIAASNGSALPALLASPAATRFVARLTGATHERTVLGAAGLYRSLLRSAREGGGSPTVLPVPEYWIARQPHFVGSGPDRVSVTATHNPPAVWRAPIGWGGGMSFSSGGEVQYVDAPPGNGTTGYAPLADRYLHPGTKQSGTAGGPPVAALDVVGEFDPRRLAQYSSLTKVPLETFFPSAPVAVSEASARVLGGRRLRPSTDLAAYLAEPPSLLTTMTAARALIGGDRYVGSDAGRPISAILVRLDGSLGTSNAARERIEAAAAAIRAATGLSVQITDGSSPTPVDVTLQPTSSSGRPATVREGWTKLGVTYAIAGTLDAKTAGLVALALLLGVLLVARAAGSIVRRRRRDLAVLLALGWAPRDMVRSVVAEVVVLSVAGALAGVVLVLAAAPLAGAHVAASTLLVTAGVAPIVAGGAALLPAWRGTRHQVIGGLRAASRRGGVRASRAGVALASLASSPARTGLSAAPLAIGVMAVATLVSLQQTFGRDLVGSRTLLGNSLDVHVRGLDLAAAGVLLVLAVTSVIDAVLSGAGERLRSHALLVALGWEWRDLTAVVVVEAGATSALGAVVGGAGATIVCSLLGAPLGTPLEAASLVAGLAVLAVLGAVWLPTTWRLRSGSSSSLLLALGTGDR